MNAPSTSFVFELRNEAETQEFGRAFAAFMPAKCTVFLSGDLGMGKTCFARAVIQALNPLLHDVPSPTFTLVQLYDVEVEQEKTMLWHVDLYRIEHETEIEELGIYDAMGNAPMLIEWPDRIREAFNLAVIHAHFSLAPDGVHRMVTITTQGTATDNYLKVIHALSHRFSHNRPS